MTTLDPERQKLAKEYARIRRRLWLVDTSITAIYTLAWLFLGWSVLLRDWLSGYTTNPWILVPAFAAVYGGIMFLINLPLSYYGGFVLPHRYDQSTQSFRDWVLDQLKGMAIALPIGLILLEGVYAFLRAFPDTWWLWTAGAVLLFQVILANLAPVLIAPIFNKYIPLGEEHADLAERLMRLAERANTKVKGVFKFDMSKRTKAANAALTGIGNTRRIVLGDTLINEFTPDEIETVLAHELGHHVHKDIPLLIGFGTVVTLVGLVPGLPGDGLGCGLFRLYQRCRSSRHAHAGVDPWCVWADHHAAWRMPSRAGVSVWPMSMRYKRPGKGKPSVLRSPVWQIRTWARSILNAGWWSCSIPILPWANASPWRRSWEG